MKTLKTIQTAFAAALVVFAAGCTNEELTPDMPNANSKQVTIHAGMPDDANTRVAFDDTDLSLKWQSGDKLKVSRNGDDKEYTLDAGGEGKTSGSFTGDVVDDSGNGNYTITYPASFTSMKGQHQTSDGNTDHLKSYIVLETTVANLADKFTLAMTSSIMKFSLSSIPSDIGALKSLTWVAEGNSNSILSLDLTGCSATNDALTAYLSFLPSEMDIKADGRFSVVLTGDKTYRTEATIATGKTYQAGMRYEAAMNSWTPGDLMAFTVKVDKTNGLGFNIPFPTSGTTPADITVNWGDGNEATINAGTTLANGDKFYHFYAQAGTYTITIFSSQNDATQQQIPAFNFNKNRNSFYNTRKLVSMDTPMLNTAATDFANCFRYCSALTKVSSGLFDKNTAVTDFNNCFYYCSAITEIPAGLFDKNTAVTDFNYCFYYCSAITEIPIGLFDKNTAVTDFSYSLSRTAITEIPTGLFDKNTAVTSFNSCFSLCTGITEIPARLFDNNTAVTDFSSCFSYCSATEIPAGLFDKNTAVTDFSGCFNNTAITEIPTGLFDKNTAVTDFIRCFESCTAITEIPTGLFDKNTAVTNFNSCFMSCTAITEIPTGLFDNNTAVTDFGSCFNSTAITEIPAGLFDNNTVAIDFGACFAFCPLTKIPTGLFDKNTAAMYFGSCFNSTAITEIPAGLFDMNTAAVDFSSCFYSCPNLKLNNQIFSLGPDKDNRFKGQDMNFAYCFRDVGNALTDVSGSVAPDLWNYTMGGGIDTEACFDGCKVSNDADIPDAWKQ